MKKKSSSKAVILIICCYLAIPLLLTFIYSIFSEWKNVLPSGLTFKYYKQILSDSYFINSVIRTLIISMH